METPVVNFDDFNEENLINEQCKPTTIEVKGQKINYTDIPLKYTHELTKSDGSKYPLISYCVVECPVLTTFSGITETRDENKTTYSICTTFDMSRDDNRSFAAHPSLMKEGEKTSFCFRLINRAAAIINENKSQFSQYAKAGSRINVEEIKKNMNEFLKIPMDANGKVIEGKNPTKFFSLLKFEKDGKCKKAVFTALGNPKVQIPWEKLRDRQMKFVPKIAIKKIYIGSQGTMSIQVQIMSAVVVDISMSISSEESLYVKALREKEDVVNKLNEKLIELDIDVKTKAVITEPPKEEKISIDSIPGIPQVITEGATPAEPPALSLGAPAPISFSSILAGGATGLVFPGPK